MAFLTREFNIGNIALELLKDCTYGCTGCSVSTEGVTPYTEGDLDVLSKFISDVREGDWKMEWIEIAPVDIMTASNRTEILKHPKIRSMMKGFKSVVFNCSFLDPKPDHYVEFAKELEEFMPGLNAEFLTPVEFKHYNNVGYMEKLKGRIAWLEENLTTVKIGSVTTVVNMTEKMMDNGIVNEKSLYDTRHIKLYDKSGTTTFVFHHGRKDLTIKANADEFLRTILKQNEAFSNQIKKGYELTIDDLGEPVGMDFHLSYRDGELYIAPLINSPIAVFHDEFKLSKPWTVDGLWDQDQDRFFESLTLAKNSPDCSGCRFVSKCASRGVHRVQKILDTTKCLSVLGTIGDHSRW